MYFVLTVHFDLPLVLDGAGAQLHVLGPAGEKLSLVGLARDEDDGRGRNILVGTQLEKK